MTDRRTVLKYLAGATATSLGPLERFAQALPQGNVRANIVCIIGEGLRSDEFSFEGRKALQTPNMDRLSRGGCTFEMRLSPMRHAFRRARRC